MTSRRLACLLPLLLCLFARRLPAEELCLVDAAMKRADPRLAQRVTLTETRLPLGALLERLTARTGVSLRMDDTSEASGAMLLVMLHDQPLADTMNALYAFFGYRKARWEWRRSGEAGKYSYYFAQTQDSRELSTVWKQQAHEAFKDHVKVMFEIARMTPEERKRSADKLDKSLLDCDDYTGKNWVGHEEIWQAIRAFQDSVKPEDQQRVLAGGSITVPMANLTQEGRAFATKQASFVTLTENGQTKPSSPEGIHFWTVWQEGDTAPMFGAENLSQMGGYALQKGLNIRQAASWLLEGDARTHPVEKLILKAPRTPYPETLMPENPTVEQMAKMAANYQTRNDLLGVRLQQLAHEMPQSLMAHLPDVQRVDSGEPYGKTPAEFLAKAKKYDIPFMQKWRGDTLLIEYPAWYLQQAQNIPYAVWKPFAQAVAASKGNDALPLPVVAKLLSALSEKQCAHLLIDAPALEPAVRTLSGLLILAAQYPDLLRENGAPTSPALTEDLSRTRPNSYSKPYKVGAAAC